MCELTAIALALGVGFATVALVGFDPFADSLNSAGSQQNLLGTTGAVAADLLLQLGGIFGAVVLLVVLTGYAYGLWVKQPPSYLFIRLLCLVFAVASIGGLAELLGLAEGGLLASFAIRGTKVIAHTSGFAFLAPLICGGLFLAFFYGAAGWSLRSWGVATKTLLIKPLVMVTQVVAVYAIWLPLKTLTGLVVIAFRGGSTSRRLGISRLSGRFNTASGIANGISDEPTSQGVRTPQRTPRGVWNSLLARLGLLPHQRQYSPPSPPPVVPAKRKLREGTRAFQERTPKLFSETKGEKYAVPFTLLEDLKSSTTAINQSALQANAKMLVQVLLDYGIEGKITKVSPGPVVTLYELEPKAGVKSSRVVSLSDDIARSMSAISARIAAVPGRNVIGIELPNESRQSVFLREILSSKEYERTNAELPLALGKAIDGKPIIVDLARMPHLLIAGTTGAGKSVGLNAMILSLLYRLSPEECRFIMIDPKMLELSVYDGIRHLMIPVVTEPKKAIVALKWAVREMERRYRLIAESGCRNRASYNSYIARKAARSASTSTPTSSQDPDSIEPPPQPLPLIVIVVDEMADLMLTAGKEIEAAIQRLSQMARAAGIHLLMATQRPSVDVITGTIKANFPSRISFQVSSKIDSRTVLGESGAENLLGAGDMLYMTAGEKLSRIHGPFVSEKEVAGVASWIKNHLGEPAYAEDLMVASNRAEFGEDTPEEDELYPQAVELVRAKQKASTSLIQRYFKIGYNRAANLIEQLEAKGIISEANHVGKREINIK